MGLPTPHCRVETKEGFLGEEALGQGLAEGENGSKTSSSFLPALTLGALPQHHMGICLPSVCLIKGQGQPCTLSRPTSQGHQGQALSAVLLRQDPAPTDTHSPGQLLPRGPLPLPAQVGRGLQAMGTQLTFLLVKTWQSGLVTDSKEHHSLRAGSTVGSSVSQTPSLLEHWGGEWVG